MNRADGESHAYMPPVPRTRPSILLITCHILYIYLARASDDPLIHPERKGCPYRLTGGESCLTSFDGPTKPIYKADRILYPLLQEQKDTLSLPTIRPSTRAWTCLPSFSFFSPILQNSLPNVTRRYAVRSKGIRHHVDPCPSVYLSLTLPDYSVS